MVNRLLRDIAVHCAAKVKVVIVENVPDSVRLETGGIPFPMEVIAHHLGRGFGANHNIAFARCVTPFFCVLNPDLRVSADPLDGLVRTLDARDAAIAGPLVRSPEGAVEDSARHFPTPVVLATKLFRKAPVAEYPVDRGTLEVDWVAGMCMLFRSEYFRAVGGFDEAYFLYYEDVDICWRLRKAGCKVLYNPAVEVTHDARRSSRRDLRLARHHVRGMLRFLVQRRLLNAATTRGDAG